MTAFIGRNLPPAAVTLVNIPNLFPTARKDNRVLAYNGSFTVHAEGIEATSWSVMLILRSTSREGGHQSLSWPT